MKSAQLHTCITILQTYSIHYLFLKKLLVKKRTWPSHFYNEILLKKKHKSHSNAMFYWLNSTVCIKLLIHLLTHLLWNVGAISFLSIHGKWDPTLITAASQISISPPVKTGVIKLTDIFCMVDSGRTRSMINLFPSPLATAFSVSFPAISPIENEKLPLCDIVCINIKYILYY